MIPLGDHHFRATACLTFSVLNGYILVVSLISSPRMIGVMIQNSPMGA